MIKAALLIVILISSSLIANEHQWVQRDINKSLYSQQVSTSTDGSNQIFLVTGLNGRIFSFDAEGCREIKNNSELKCATQEARYAELQSLAIQQQMDSLATSLTDTKIKASEIDSEILKLMEKIQKAQEENNNL